MIRDGFLGKGNVFCARGRPRSFGEINRFSTPHNIRLSFDDALHVRLWWQNVAPIPLDYSISLQALDASGTLVAQSDGQIDDYGREIVSTSQMQPGRIYVDERSIMLPAGTSGEVRLQLLVYQSWDDRRLMLDDGRETIDLGVVNSEE